MDLNFTADIETSHAEEMVKRVGAYAKTITQIQDSHESIDREEDGTC